MKSSKKTKGGVTERKGASAHEQEPALFLLLAWPIEIGELWLARRQYFFVRVHLVIKVEGVVRVSEVLLFLFFDPLVGCNPVKQLRSIFLILAYASWYTSRALSWRTFSSSAALESFPERKRAR